MPPISEWLRFPARLFFRREDERIYAAISERRLLPGTKLSEERLAKEARNREQLKAGKLGLDMYGLRAKLQALGVEYLDRAPE